MKIKPMLTRLQNTIGRDDLIEQMILAPSASWSMTATNSNFTSIDKNDGLGNTAKFIVAYNSSCYSHTALDIALCMAHQARLASNMRVLVQAVYVVEEEQNCYIGDTRDTRDTYINTSSQPTYEYFACDLPNTSKSVTPVLLEQRFHESCLTKIEQADNILYSARSLAEEWQSNFKAYLRFGSVAAELKQVVQSENADILFLGCKSFYHPLVQSLGSDLGCTILGIPTSID